MPRILLALITALLFFGLTAGASHAEPKVTDGWLKRSQFRVSTAFLRVDAQSHAFRWQGAAKDAAADQDRGEACTLWDRGLREAFQQALGSDALPDVVAGALGRSRDDAYAAERPLKVTAAMAHLYRDPSRTVDLGAGPFIQYTEDARMDTMEGLEYTDRVFWSRRPATQDWALGLGICVNF